MARPDGTTAATVANGRLRVPLFGPKTVLDGTVGADGTLRASGLWPNPHGGFPGITVLNGSTDGHVLRGMATDYRCHTEIDLKKDRPAARHRAAMPWTSGHE